MNTNKKDEVIEGVYELGHLYTDFSLRIDTINMISEMESYRGKISSDIDNVIDWQIKRNLTTILKRIRKKEQNND